MFVVVITTAVKAQKTEQRNVSNFSRIEVRQGIDVNLTISDSESLELTAPKKYIDRIVTEVINDKLFIYIKQKDGTVINSGLRFKFTDITINLNAKKVTSIEVNSGASVTTVNSINNVQELELSSSSGADINVKCKVNKVEAEASSGSDIRISGSAHFLSVDASSGADIRADKLNAKEVKADVSSGADITVSVSKKIDADASSGGSLKYCGNPPFVDIEKSSGGSVRKW